jgi:conjugal transfer pilus assembly protein TraD
MSAIRKFEMPWRQPWEVYSAVSWGVATVAMGMIAFFTSLPKSPFLYMGGAAMVMCLLRSRQTANLLNFKMGLFGKPFSWISGESVIRIMKEHPGSLFLGYGFKWSPIHTQRVMEICNRGEETLMPPAWFLKLKKINVTDWRNSVGSAWIHGVEPTEELILNPRRNREGHTMVWGTTGAGKTRMLEEMLFQDVMAGDVVILLDPKGDKEAKDIAERVAAKAGRPFVYFHPAFPSQSVRIDPLKNFSRTTEIASRISMLLGGDGDSFVQFAWRTINQAAEAMVYVGERPSLMKLRRVIEGGPERLAERVFRAYFEANLPGYEALIEPFIQMAREGKKLKKPTDNSSYELTAMWAYYQSKIPAEKQVMAVDGISSMLAHPREHAQKMLTVLVPLMTMLTSGELGELLSPDASNINDHRAIWDSEKIVKQGAVVYAGLDSLSDGVVGSAIGSIFLADLTAYAGAAYNYGVDGKIIQLYIDEAAELVNDPVIQLMNKGRGAGFQLTLFSQTLPDFVVRLGSEAKAKKLLGNFNTTISLRLACDITAEYVVGKLLETSVQSVVRSQGQGSKSEDSGIEFSGNVSETIVSKDALLFPSQLLMQLNNLHFIAIFAGGKLWKGRLSKLVY